VQETFIRAFRSVDGFGDNVNFALAADDRRQRAEDFGRRAARRKVVPLDEAVRDVTGEPHEQEASKPRRCWQQD